MKIVERIKAPIPKFFKILRNVGLVLLAISGTVVAAPVVLPAVVVSVAGYMAVAGGILSAVSQMTVSPVVPKGDRKGEEEILRQAQDDNNKPRDGD
jgi:energy-converting hydrogenase Eha subunit G